MEIICGSYNNMIFGYHIDLDYNEKLSFTNEAHASLVKCLSVSRNGLLASAGTDEMLKIFDLSKRKEIGSMMHLNGSITDMLFHENSHLFTSCETGEIAICDSKTWTISHILKHKSVVLSFTIHKSGKLLLSSCKDRTLQTWNLITGRRAFVTNLIHEAEIVKFSTDGNLFVTIHAKCINSFMTKNGKLNNEIIAPNRIVTAQFINNDILSIGCESGFIYFYNILNGLLVHTISTDTVRIKSLNFTTSSHLVSVSSDGFILIHFITMKKNSIESELKKSISTSHRWLCVATFEENNNHKNDEIDEKLNLNKKTKIDKDKIKRREFIKSKNSNCNIDITKIKRKKDHNVSKNQIPNVLKNITIGRILDDNQSENNDDIYKEDDGSCPSNEEESDEEKSYKDQQKKLKRFLSNQSETSKKKFKHDNDQFKNQIHGKTNFKLNKGRSEENFSQEQYKYKKDKKTYGSKSPSFKGSIKNNYKNSHNKFGMKSFKDFNKKNKNITPVNKKHLIKRNK